MKHEAATSGLLTYEEDGQRNAIANKLPMTQADWWDKRRATDTVLEEIGGVVTRVGGETVGKIGRCSTRQDVLNEVERQFARKFEAHIRKVLVGIPSTSRPNTDHPMGDRSKPPQEQDPDMRFMS